MNVTYAIEGTKIQRPNERLAYTITTTPWGSTPTSITMVVWDVTNPASETDVTSSTTEGSTSVSGDVITTKRVYGLTRNKDYRVEVKFQTSDNNTWEVAFNILCRT